MNSREVWFHRGKLARHEGKPRELPDGRCASESRLAFYDGWDYQEAAEKPLDMTAVEEWNSFLTELKTSLLKG